MCSNLALAVSSAWVHWIQACFFKAEIFLPISNGFVISTLTHYTQVWVVFELVHKQHLSTKVFWGTSWKHSFLPMWAGLAFRRWLCKCCLEARQVILFRIEVLNEQLLSMVNKAFWDLFVTHHDWSIWKLSKQLWSSWIAKSCIAKTWFLGWFAFPNLVKSFVDAMHSTLYSFEVLNEQCVSAILEPRCFKTYLQICEYFFPLHSFCFAALNCFSSLSSPLYTCPWRHSLNFVQVWDSIWAAYECRSTPQGLLLAAQFCPREGALECFGASSVDQSSSLASSSFTSSTCTNFGLAISDASITVLYAQTSY